MVSTARAGAAKPPTSSRWSVRSTTRNCRTVAEISVTASCGGTTTGKRTTTRTEATSIATTCSSSSHNRIGRFRPDIPRTIDAAAHSSGGFFRQVWNTGSPAQRAEAGKATLDRLGTANGRVHSKVVKAATKKTRSGVCDWFDGAISSRPCARELLSALRSGL